MLFNTSKLLRGAASSRIPILDKERSNRFVRMIWKIQVSPLKSTQKRMQCLQSCCCICWHILHFCPSWALNTARQWHIKLTGSDTQKQQHSQIRWYHSFHPPNLKIPKRMERHKFPKQHQLRGWISNSVEFYIISKSFVKRGDYSPQIELSVVKTCVFFSSGGSDLQGRSQPSAKTLQNPEIQGHLLEQVGQSRFGIW